MQNDTIQREPNAEVEKLVDNLTLFDDTLMSKVFDKNIPATTLLLQIILERDDIKVIKVKGQESLKNPYPKGRNLTLDIHAVDNNGIEFDVEVQRNSEGSHPRRARFHSSMMDSRMLKQKQEFKELRDAYVIFICQHDKFRKGKPVYHVDKIIRETGKLFDDGAHIIYVNGTYKGDDAFGKLAHDFNCKSSKNMYFKELAEGVRHFKENAKGRDDMCEAVEKYAAKRSENMRIETLANAVNNLMQSTSFSLEESLNNMGIEGEDRELIIERLSKK